MGKPATESRSTGPGVGPARETLSELIAKILDQLSVSAWLPAGVLIFGFLVIGSIRAADGSVHGTLNTLAHLSAASLILLFVAMILATVLTQAFQFEAIQLLEGYWGPGRIRDRLADWRCGRHVAKRNQYWARLEELQTDARNKAISEMRDRDIPSEVPDLLRKLHQGDLAMDRLPKKTQDLVRRYPWQQFADAEIMRRIDGVAAAARLYLEDDHAILPTALGNTLRSYEDPIEAQIERPIDTFVQDIFDTLPPFLQTHHDHLRSRLRSLSSPVRRYAFEISERRRPPSAC